jgi:hypothetical protein
MYLIKINELKRPGEALNSIAMTRWPKGWMNICKSKGACPWCLEMPHFVELVLWNNEENRYDIRWKTLKLIMQETSTASSTRRSNVTFNLVIGATFGLSRD